MPPKINEYIEDKALGDGNCGLNAFILGLSHAKSLEEIQSQIKHEGFSIDTNLLTLSKEDLQKELAPILRKLHYQLAENNAEHLERTQQPLLSAFRDFAENALGIKVKQNDDIFVKYFKDQFLLFVEQLKKANLNIDTYNQLKNKQDKTNDEIAKLKVLTDELNRHFELIQKELLIWWQSFGYNQFLEKLRQNGEYVGDLELSLLARYFNVNLIALRGATINHPIYFDHGTIPVANDQYQLRKEDIDQLVVRGVVNMPENATELRLLNLDESYQARLASIPEFDKVKNYITENKNNIDRTVVPDWSNACLSELKKRDVIEESVLQDVSGDSTTVSLFKVTGDTALERIEAIKDQEKIIATIETNRKELPIVTLVNQNTHWDNVFVIETKPEVVEVETISAQAEEQQQPEPTKSLVVEVETAEEKTVDAEPPTVVEESPSPVIEPEKVITNEKNETTTDEIALPHNVREKTLEKLENNEIRFDQNKWDQLLKKVARYENPSASNQSSVEPKSDNTKTLVSYFFAKNKEIDIDRKLQIKLDEQLASQLQEEEYTKYKNFKP